MSQNEQSKNLEKIKHLLSEISLQTYLYALLAIGVIILVVSNVKLGNKSYLVNKNSDSECRDPHGKIIKIDPSKGEGCVDIFGAAKDYGIDLSYIDSKAPNSDNAINNNITLEMSKDLILTNIYLNQNGVTDEATRGKILAGVLDNYSSKISGKIYSKSDLNLNREETKSSYILYYNEIASSIVKYNNEIKAYNKSHNISNISGLSDEALLDKVKTNMKDLININNELINSLLSISTTNAGSEYQLRLINLISKQSAYLDSLGNLSQDPMKYIALGGDAYLNKFQTDLKSSINDFNKYFISLGILNK